MQYYIIYLSLYIGMIIFGVIDSFTIPTTSTMVPATTSDQSPIVISYIDSNLLVERAINVFEKKKQQLSIDDQPVQVIIGIAGCPGSGKSTRAEKVCDLINKQGIYKSIVVPMDGYHLSKSELLSLSESNVPTVDYDNTTTSNNQTIIRNSGISYEYDDLMKRRGAPWTFNPTKLVDDLTFLKDNRYGNFPEYSRDISDPVPDAILVQPDTQIIFCEGNYLLCYDNELWSPLQGIFDDTWYIAVPLEIIKSRLVARHLKRWTPEKEQRFGYGRAGATRKVEESDLLNAIYIESMSKQYTNVIVNNF